jgi:hypothetical protein
MNFYITNIKLFVLALSFFASLMIIFGTFKRAGTSRSSGNIYGPDNWRLVFVGSDTGMPQGDSLLASLGQLGACLALAIWGACPLQPTFWW